MRGEACPTQSAGGCSNLCSSPGAPFEEGGQLTAWIAEEDRFVAVPVRQAWRTPRGSG